MMALQSDEAARRLAEVRAAREVVPSDPELSARWHRHGVPSPFSRWNYHPEYEVHLITEGTGWFVVGDCIDVFQAGQLVLVGSNVPHHWISDLEPGERLDERDTVFQFHPDWVASCAVLLPELGRLEPLLRESRRGIEFGGPARSAAADHLQAIGSSHGAGRLECIFGLLAAMADAPQAERRLLSDQRPPGPGRYPEPGTAERLDRAYAYLRDRLPDPDLRMRDAARHVGLSESAFSRYFSQVSGRSFTDTLRRMRLAQAGKLLRDTTVPVAAVAHRVGYANLSNFNRQFRYHHGHTPREHRAANRPSEKLAEV